MRRDLFRRLTDPRRDIDDECGFPKVITPQMYQDVYEREPLAAAVVERWPLEAFQVWPEIYDVEDEKAVSPFEQAIYDISKSLCGQTSYYREEEGSALGWYLRQVTIDSRVARYGVLLVGIDDGLPLSQPAAGISEVNSFPRPAKGQDRKALKGVAQYVSNAIKHPPYSLTVNDAEVAGRKLLYLRSFTEVGAPIAAFEANRNSPRYGYPTHYRIVDVESDTVSGDSAAPPIVNELVHWTRVVHVCEGEVFHRPPMKQVFNDLCSERKLAGGSPEGFWKQCFATLVLESLPQLGPRPRIDRAAVRGQVEKWQNSLQKVLMLVGMSAKTLAPQVTDPTPHHNLLVERICVKERMPVRIFKGSERGEQASTQDDTAWNDRVGAYEVFVVSAKTIVPVIDRLIMLGCLPIPAEDGFCIYWPDITSMSAAEKASVASTRQGAIASHVDKGRELMTDMDFLTKELDFSSEEAQQIVDNLEEQQASLDEAQAILDEQDAADAADASTPDDQLPLAEEVPASNTFCPTGPGGGVDATCGKDGGGGGVSGKLAGLKTGMKLTKGILTKLDLVNPDGAVGGIVKVPAGLDHATAQAIADKLGAKYEKVNTKGMLKSLKEGVTPASIATHLHTGDGVAHELGLSGEQAKQVAEMNPNGIKGGQLLLPKGADVATADELMPPGTKIKVVASDAKGKVGKPLATPTTSTTYGGLKEGESYVNSAGATKIVESAKALEGGKVELTFKGESGKAVLAASTLLPLPPSAVTAPTDEPTGKWSAKAELKAHSAEVTSKLSNEQRKAIRSYTGAGSGAINSAMRQCPPNFECVEGYVKTKMDLIQKALDSAPPFPKPTLVKRGMSLDESKAAKFAAAMADAHASGKDFQFPSFASTSIEAGFSGNVKFRVLAKSGLYVKALSEHPHEEEVILSPKTKYKVSKVESGGGYHVIHLEEK